MSTLSASVTHLPQRSVMTYHRLHAVASRLLERAKAFPQRPGYHEADPLWVSQLPRVSARSPFTVQRRLLRFLLDDQDFPRAVPEATDLLLEVAVGVMDIRANLYLIEVGPLAPDLEHSRTPLFDPNWPKTGIYRYHINPQGEVEFLIRPRPGYLFDSLDVIYSYGRELTPAERAYVLSVSRL